MSRQLPGSTPVSPSLNESDTFSQTIPSTQFVVNGSRPSKLRSSCDGCAAAKVRCSKTHPECTRCVKGRVKCVYGPSRKFGKPRVKATTKPGTNIEIEPRRIEASIDAGISTQRLCSQLESQSSWNEWLQNNGSENSPDLAWFSKDNINGAPASRWFSHSNTPELDTGAAFAIEQEHMNAIAILDPITPSSLDLESRLPPVYSSFDNFQDPPTVASSNVTTPFEQVPSLSSPASSQFSDLTDPKNRTFTKLISQESNMHKCEKLASSTLEGLGLGQSNFNASNGSATQNLDNILSQNKIAMNAVNELLTCPCSGDPHLAMLYASITSKILIRYQIAAGLPKVPHAVKSAHATTSSSSTRSSSLSRPQSSNVPPLQVKLGSFNLDEEDQEAFSIYLVLNELKKLGQVVDLFGSKGARRDIGGGLGDLYASLGRWLKNELTRTFGLLKEGLIKPADEVRGIQNAWI